MLFSFLLVVHFVIALALVTVILMQRSEGGGLTGGGSPAGLMSARGASDFLTRSTAILATVFVVLSIFDCATPAAVVYFETRVTVMPLCVVGPQVTLPLLAEKAHELSG